MTTLAETNSPRYPGFETCTVREFMPRYGIKSTVTAYRRIRDGKIRHIHVGNGNNGIRVNLVLERRKLEGEDIPDQKCPICRKKKKY